MFGFKTKRAEQLLGGKCFIQLLLNYSQIFSTDSNYIFFAHSLTQKITLQSQINIALRKVTSGQLIAGMFNSNFDETVRDFIANDKTFAFMNCIKRTPTY